MPAGSISFGEIILLVFALFIFGAWLWVTITIITDLFRDHELAGWAKAIWLLFLLFVPFLTGFAYLVTRSSGMDDRAMRAIEESRQRHGEPASSLTDEELATLENLREKGALTDTELEAAKARRFA